MKLRILKNLKFFVLLILFQTYSQNELPNIEFEEIVIDDDDGLQSWENLDYIYEDEDGIFWTSINEGVFRYNGHSAINFSEFLSKNYDIDLDSQTTTTFLKKDSTLWIGRRKGLVKLNLKTLDHQEVYIDKPLLSSNYRNLVLELESKNDTLYVGTGNGLYLIDEKSQQVLKSYLNEGIEIEHRESSNAVQSLYLDIEPHAIWVVMNTGLYRINKLTDKIDKYALPSLIWNNKHHFNSGHVYNDYLLMPGYGSGIIKFDFNTKKFTRYYDDRNPDYLLPKTGINEHWYNNIVRSEITYNDSLSLINFQRHGNAFFNRNTGEFNYLNTPEGMHLGVFFNIDKSGYIWTSKIGRIWRSKEPLNNYKNGIANHIIDISSIEANGTLERSPSIEGYDSITIDQKRNIKLKLTISNPYVYDKIVYEYKLNGNSWKTISKPNELSLNKLSYKKHNLSIRALDINDNILANRELFFEITIPFYKTTYFIIFCISLSFIILFLVTQYFQSKRIAKKMIQLDKIKSSFFTNISHEFRTPLTLISSSIQSLTNDDNISNDQKNHFNNIERNSDRLLTLVNQLLNLSEIEVGALKIKVENKDISTFIHPLSEAFVFPAKQKDINYKNSINLDQKRVWFDTDALEKIIVNLLSNAIKYTPNQGTVVFKCNSKNDKLYIEVKNTGKGLTDFELNNVFERFYRTSEDEHGSGIGLALTKELVTLHKGSIDVKSKVNEWTIFSVTLPTNKESFKKFEIKTNPFNDNKVPTLFEETSNSREKDQIIDDDLPVLLIVEDNSDVQQLLNDLFEDNYTIYRANNGQEGLELALEQIPDLIISDIMMPIKDGICLTQDIKSNEITSHIPIILLTAKASDEDELVGIDSGADDYITKPFNVKILKSKIEKLINIRKQLQTRYSKELVLTPKNICVTAIDEQFMDKIQHIFDESLVKPSFSVIEFSKAIGMSRMQLHRKLKALTGLSSSEFIRSQRLKLAAQLLQESDANVSQIGYEVGFNNHSYFTKCFKEMYGVTPSEYAIT